MLLQNYLAVVAITDLFLAAGIVERNRAAGRLAEAGRRKDELLAILGHELRNPLGVIKTALEILRIGGGATDPTVERTPEVLEHQTRHLTRLVGDLIDLSRIARGELPLSPARVDLRALVAKAAETVGPVVEERRHRQHDRSVERRPGLRQPVQGAPAGAAGGGAGEGPGPATADNRSA